jgi:hypothetical protein
MSPEVVVSCPIVPAVVVRSNGRLDKNGKPEFNCRISAGGYCAGLRKLIPCPMTYDPSSGVAVEKTKRPDRIWTTRYG